MKKNLWIFILVIILLVAAIVWYFVDKKDVSSQEEQLDLIAEVYYVCDEGKIIEAGFYKGEEQTAEPGEQPIPTGEVTLVFDGQTLTLPQTISADGGRYANSDESFIFWDKGDKALVFQDGVEKDFTNCQLQ